MDVSIPEICWWGSGGRLKVKKQKPYIFPPARPQNKILHSQYLWQRSFLVRV